MQSIRREKEKILYRLSLKQKIQELQEAQQTKKKTNPSNVRKENYPL